MRTLKLIRGEAEPVSLRKLDEVIMVDVAAEGLQLEPKLCVPAGRAEESQRAAPPRF
jgi:hypothetical protein